MGDGRHDAAATTSASLTERVAALMPQLEEDLARLVAIPSVSSSGYAEPRQPLLDAFRRYKPRIFGEVVATNGEDVQ